MSEYIAALSVVGVVAVLLAALIYALPHMLRHNEEEPMAPVPRPMTVDTAHRIMRIHRRCSVANCLAKRDAYLILVEAGAIVPDVRAERFM